MEGMVHMDIKAGEVVELKSGGPPMTVRDVKNGMAWCQWFEGANAKGDSFATTSLKPAKEQS